ncbi:ankyrin repeat domain-containing protein [Erwinia sp. V71]|uniref:ankyrin repeat domain-containing protein n=1 Tax=Erwinia sp. V71 TaxID=3369424 RepID=UPI003F607317
MQWLTKFKWMVVLFSGMLSACQAGGHKMQIGELFDPPMVTLLQAIRQGDEAQARRLMAEGVDLNTQGKQGITPLLWLIYQTQDKAATRLALTLGANPNYKDGSGDTAVNRVAGVKDPEWLSIILAAGGDPNSIGRQAEPALFNAIREERWANTEMLVERGADVNLPDGLSRNSALYAAYLNQYDFTWWLIEQGASVKGYDRSGADLSWMVHDSLSIMSPESPRYKTLLKVKHTLEQQGVTFPPPSPKEIRALRAKGEKI